MPAKLKTIWTATFDLGGANERILVTPSDFLESELELGGAQVTEDGDYIEADDSEPLAYGRTKRTIKITVHKSHASPEAAREYALEVDRTIPVNVTANLTLAISGGDTYVYSHAAFQSWTTTPRRIGLHETATTYELKCGALSLGAPTGPTGPTPVGLDAYPLSLAAKLELLTAAGGSAGHGAALATWGNQGTGDDATQATSGARPTVIAGTGTYHPGIAGNYTEVLHTNGLNFGASFALRWDGTLPSYRPAARVCLLSKWHPTGNQRSYALYLEPSGALTLAMSTDGTSGGVVEFTSAAVVSVAGGTYVGLYVVKNATALDFYIYQDAGWTRGFQLGATQTITNYNPFDSTANFLIGATAGGTADLMEGFTSMFQASVGTGGWFVDSTLLRLGSGAGTAVANPSPWSGWNAAVRSGDKPLMEIGTAHRAQVRTDGVDDSMALADPVPLNAVSGATLAWLGFLNRVTGTNDLITCAAPGGVPRAVLRVDGGDLKLLVRRLDGESTATITATAAVAAYYAGSLGAVIDYAAGTATLYKGGSPLVTGSLTSAGTTSATDSTETRIMAGIAAANPAAGDVLAVAIGEAALDTFAYTDLLLAMNQQLT
jgi:hypothetical protein